MTDAKISLGKVESELYRAYTKSDGGVIAKVGDGIRTTVGSDAFSPYINSAYIKNAVGRLPSLQVAVIESKYGRLPTSLQSLARHISVTCNLSIEASEYAALIWLGYSQLKIKDLLPLTNRPYPTLTRQIRKIFLSLDEVKLQALETLQQQLSRPPQP